MIEQRTDIARARAMSHAATPSGDFMALVSSAVAVIFTFLGFYQAADGVVVKGFETPYGLIVLTAAAACGLFAMAVLGSKLINPDSWFSRSPGWAYFTASAVVVIMSFAAMVIGLHDYAVGPGPVASMAAGLFLGLAGMMKF